MDPSTPIMSDEGTPIAVPRKPTFREGVLPGYYANQMQLLESQFETALDFLQISLSEYTLPEEGQAGFKEVTISNEVVARVILPRGIVQLFVQNYMRNNPAFAEAVIASLKSGKSQ